MFGFLKKKARSENIKMVSQTALAVGYMCDFSDAVSQTGSQPGMMDPRECAAVLDDLLALGDKVHTNGELTKEEFAALWNLNKVMRQNYDSILLGRTQFAKKFGSATEKLEAFDQKFQPPVGWKIFSEHFSGGAAIRELLPQSYKDMR